MSILTRIVVDIILFVAVFIAPWWLSVPLICLGVFWFPYFYEALIFGMLLDGFHGIPSVTFFGINGLFTTIVSVVFLIAVCIKPRLRFY